ncbi:glyoxalase [Streptomyces tateyamensis]|uniref:Glyoxalase n=1 Tax=Streptomyces tateyamensis TaxID=565073 RepID=A0A2V4P8Z8_9ACTN|nr:VOC family protein [Streptomyces tateyamensis]PYC86935.1 glyoxalase [Streptomyces tateyamensis]
MAEATGLRWSHVGLNCSDLDRTEEFYRTWFGFERARVVDLGDDRIVFLRKGPAYLELFHSTSAAAPAAGADGPQQPGTIRHLAFQTDDIDGFLAKAEGVLPFSLGPLEFDDFIEGWKTVWVTDPDGVVVEVSQGYQDAGSTA